MTRTVDIQQDHINGISRDDILATIEDLQTLGAVQPNDDSEPYTYTLYDWPLSTSEAVAWLRDKVAQIDADDAS